MRPRKPPSLSSRAVEKRGEKTLPTRMSPGAFWRGLKSITRFHALSFRIKGHKRLNLDIKEVTASRWPLQ